MNTFEMFSSHELVEDTKRWVKKEREATLAVIERLREIERRSIPESMGYAGLFEFCVHELQYSSGATFRRVHAMRLCEELPEAKKSIAEGKLSLTTAATLETYLEK